MSLSLAVTEHWEDGKRIHVIGRITASANYATGGETLSFNAPGVKSAQIPSFVHIDGDNGYMYQYVNGTTLANGKLKVMTGPNTEIGAGAYPAQVIADVILVHAIFRKFF